MWRLRKDKARLAATVVLALCTAGFFAAAFAGSRALTKEYAGLSVRISDGPVAGKKLKRLLLQETDGRAVCTAAWTRTGRLTAEAASLDTSARLRVATVYGDIRQAVPLRLVSGSLLTEDDCEGCLLDTESAQALFHSVDVTGAKLTAGGAAYTVRGVAETYEPLLIARSKTAAYENLEFAIADLSTGKADAEAFLYRYAVSGDYVVVQSGLYARVLYGLAFLLAALLLLTAAARLLFFAVRRREARLRERLASLLVSALLCAGAALLLRGFYWPQAFLPTKCADFAFWGRLYEGWRETWRAVTLVSPLPKDVLFFQRMRGCLLCVAAAGAGSALLCARLRGAAAARKNGAGKGTDG